MDYQNKTILHINHILRIAGIILKLNYYLSSFIFMNDSQISWTDISYADILTKLGIRYFSDICKLIFNRYHIITRVILVDLFYLKNCTFFTAEHLGGLLIFRLTRHLKDLYLLNILHKATTLQAKNMSKQWSLLLKHLKKNYKPW